MHPARIAELLEPFLGPQANDQRPTTDDRSKEDALYQDISTYIDLLLRWNARINLTAIRNPEEIVTRHFGESLFAARHLFPVAAPVGTPALGCPAERSSAARVNHTDLGLREDLGGHDFSRAGSISKEEGALAPEGLAHGQRPLLACPERSEGTDDRITAADLGSGAGLPGIPIKLWAPHVALTLIESSQKKVAFLREVVRTLTLTDIDIFPGRAESLLADVPDENQSLGDAPHSRTFDVVTLRAVERLADILPTAVRLLAPGGRLALLVGLSQLDLVRSSLPALTWRQPMPVPLSNSRILLLGLRA